MTLYSGNIVIILFTVITLVNSQKIPKSRILEDINFQDIVIFSSNMNTSLKLMKSMISKTLKVQFHDFNQLQKKINSEDGLNYVFMITNFDNFNLQLIMNLDDIKVGKYLLVGLNDSTGLKQKLTKILLNNTIETMFYYFDMTLDHLIEVFVVNGLIFMTPYGSEVDLSGLELKTIELPWMPFIEVNDCDSFNCNCQIDGISADFMNLISKHFNFTYSSSLQSNNDWGLGPFNGTCLGVCGKIKNEEYDLSLASWVLNEWRGKNLDYLNLYTVKPALIRRINEINFDWTLFLRPFRNSVWYSILAILILGHISTLIILNCNAPESYKAVITILNFFFVGINMHYSGALTMFFTSNPEVEFNSLHDILKAYPEWDIKLLNGMETTIITMAKNGDHLAQEFLVRMEQNPEYYILDSVEKLWNQLQYGKTVIYVESTVMENYLNDNPLHKKIRFRKINLGSRPAGVIAPHNWPLTNLFNRYINKIKEQGILSLIYSRWIRQRMSTYQSKNSDGQIFNFSQMSLIFFIFLCLIMTSSIVLLIEFAFKKSLKL